MLKIFTPVDGKMVEAHNTDSADTYVRYEDVKPYLGIIDKAMNNRLPTPIVTKYATPPTLEAIQECCLDVVRDMRSLPDPTIVTLDTDFQFLEFDSLDKVEIIMELEMIYDADYEENTCKQFYEAKTTREIAQLVKDTTFPS
jgi:acyl carrier protein